MITMSRRRLAAMLLLAAGLAGAYGVLLVPYTLPPFHLVRAIRSRTVAPPPESPLFTSTPPELLDTRARAPIAIRNAADAVRVRRRLVTFLWGRPDLPATQPSRVDRDHLDPRYADLASLARIDRLAVRMEFGIDSTVYHFVPRSPRGSLVVYHQGHAATFHAAEQFLRSCVDRGHSVIALDMPLEGGNNQPTVDTARQGRIRLVGHDRMEYLTPEAGHAIRFLVEPVVVALNHVLREGTFERVAMVGVSGGGWTTTLAAAVDARIQLSIPVAGSYPLYLCSHRPTDWGCWEQHDRDLYDTVNHLELYVLGACGPGRRQLQILNRYDPGCFGGTLWETYVGPVQDAVRGLGGGEFDVLSDASHRRHNPSRAALERVLAEIERLPR